MKFEYPKRLKKESYHYSIQVQPSAIAYKL